MKKMTLRVVVGSVVRWVAAVALIMLFSASLALAQKATSDVRIRIHKGEHIARIDTVYQLVHDTVTQYRTDTIQAPPRARTVAVVDTVWERDRSCWRGVSLCTIGTGVAALAAGYCAYKGCMTQETHVNVGSMVAERRNRIGFAFSIPLRP